ncbi:MAG: copper resistance protein CopC [Alphaproteobacteria bacterium]|nr:copper resistance protein CopC [Alphaproteobacteria bacterium]
MRPLLVLGMLMLSAQYAIAAAVLVRADPEPDSVASIGQIELQFSETLRANGSSIMMFDSEGEPVTGTTAFGGRTLFFRMEYPPPPGVYEVRWHAMTVGGEPSEGSYHFSQVAVL